MPSCILYHGPGARQSALNEAIRLGRLLHAPIGDEGLKVDEARQVVSLLSTTPIGNQRGTLVVGPMDTATIFAADALLKKIEEFDGDMVQPVLWALDIGGVRPTIKSRCLPRWAPDTGDAEEDVELVQDGWDLSDAAQQGNLAPIAALMKKYKKREVDLMRSAVDAMASEGTAEALSLWASVRKVAMYWNPTALEITSAFMGDC